MKTFDDTTVWKAIQEGSVSAFEQLYRQHGERLYCEISRRIADQSAVSDLVQDIFLTLWEKRQHYRVEGAIYAYLHGMAINRVLNYYRTNKMQSRFLEIWDEVAAENIAIEDDPVGVEQQTATEQTSSLLQTAVSGFPNRMRQVYELRYERQLSIPEIAEQLQTSPHTIYNQIKAIKKKCIDTLKNRTFFFFF